jgi:uncharacterized iron-regulated membrane protein
LFNQAPLLFKTKMIGVWVHLTIRRVEMQSSWHRYFGGLMHMQLILLASTVLALSLVPVGALAQAVNEPSATFNERYPAEPAEPQTPEQLPSNGQPTGTAQQKSTEQPTGTVQSTSISHHKNATRQQSVTAPVRAARPERPRTRVVVVPRSFLDAGTDVQPGQERKFLDYAYPPLHQPYNVVTNIGGRVGWHNSPLPGPFFPNAN